MKNIAKILCFVLSLVLVFTVIGLNVFAEDATVVMTEAELKSAIEAGGEVKLGGNIEVTAEISVPAEVTVTLDLAGYAITSGYQTDNTKHIYPLNIYGNLTIKDSVGTGSISGRGLYVQDGSKLTVESGTIYGIDSNGGSALYQYGGDIVINGGLVEHTADYTYNYAISAGGGTITVNGGKIIGKHGALSVSGADATINGGELVCSGNEGWTDNVVYVSAGSLTVTGGTIVHNGADVGDSGAAMVATSGATSVSISGGDFTGLNGAMSSSATTTVVTGGSFADGAYGENSYDNVLTHVPAGAIVSVNGTPYLKNEDGTSKQVAAKIGDTSYPTIKAAIDAAVEGDTVELVAATIAEGTIKLPSPLKNVTIKGADGHKSILKDMTISHSDGGTYEVIGLTIDGVVFDNSNIVLTGWRTGYTSMTDFTVTNCIFKNIVRTSDNLAAVHINVAANTPITNFTFTNNVIDGVTGASNSGIYGQFSGDVIIKDNVINNVAFRPYVIQLTSDDGVADNFVVTGNTFSGSAVGRAQALTNNADGTDEINLVVSDNIFTGITDAQQICYWNFNPETTTVDLSNNYYDVDLNEYPNRIYMNSSAKSIEDLNAMGVYPYYTELNADGTINTESSYEPATVAKIGDVEYKTLQGALDAAAAGSGEVTVEILCDIDLTDVDWNPVTVSAPGYPLVTVNGNNHTITGLNDMLFAGTWAGKSGLIINDLTIANSKIENDVEDTAGTVGVGAFVGYPQASETITLNNCHLVNSTVSGGHWTGGLIGMAGGYNGNDGPVFMNLTIKNCSVIGNTITGKGSVGGVIGHGSCAAWTNVVIIDTIVRDNVITSTGSSTNKAGSVMGTIGAAGQPTTADGNTLTGGMSVDATVSGNTVTSNGTVITTIYGRQGTATGTLEINGGSYDKYPIEENVSYAYPAEGFQFVENAEGGYGVAEVSATPEIGENGNWFIGDVDTGAIAKPTISQVEGEDGLMYWVVNGETTNVQATPVDGVVPAVTIQTNAQGKINWYIDGVDTGVQAVAPNGITIVEVVKNEELSDKYVSVYVIKFSNGQSVSFTVSNGADGDQGPQGPQGPDGPKGQDGIQGVAGADGNDNNQTVVITVAIATVCLMITIAVVLYRGVDRRSWWCTK